jgi:hypothetical protein
VQTYLQPLCEQYGVSIVFGGHNHYYARAVVCGMQHITTGGGGAPLYTPVPSHPNVVASAAAYRFCKIAIDGNTLTFKAVTPAGVVLDSVTLGSGAVTGPSRPPRGPAEASARAGSSPW